MEYNDAMANLKLYYSEGSPFARKVRIMLNEKGLEYEGDVLNALRPVSEIETLNPALSVPVLEHGDVLLFESNLILEYILETYSEVPNVDETPPLAPWMRRPDNKWADGKTIAVLESLGNSIVNTSMMVHHGTRIDDSDYLKRQQQRISACLDWLESTATSDGFAPGWFSVMDINFICQIGFAEARNITTIGARPNLVALLKKFSSRPSVVTTKRPET